MKTEFKKYKQSSLLIVALIISLLGFLRINTVFASNDNMPEMNNTSAEPFELVATYKKSDIDSNTFSIIKNIATIDNTVVMEVKGNDVTLIKIYMGDKDIPGLNSNKKIIPFVNNQIKKIDFKSALSIMDNHNGESDNKNGSILLRSYPGQKYSGQHVKAGTHVHCNRFNGSYSDHKWWKESDARAWKDFWCSDCDSQGGIYGCIQSGNKKCDGLNAHGHGVHDCSAWKGGDKHHNWPKTCWYRN